MRRMIAGTKSNRQTGGSLPRRRRTQVVIAVAIVLGLFAAWTLMAYTGAFDSALRQKGKKRGTVSLASFNSNSPAKEYVYAGGRVLATEEPTASGCASPPSPGSTLVATAQSTTSVVLNWTASHGADHYEVQRRQNITSAWATLSPNPTANSFTDNGLTANTCYLYQVRAVDASGACPSALSNVDLATTVMFTEDPLQSRITIIRAQHVIEVRRAVDAVRATANIGAAVWTNPLNYLDPVRPIDFSELRSRLNEALPSLGFSPISADAGIAQGLTIYAAHLQAVRDKVK